MTESKLLSIREAAEHLGMSCSWLYQAVELKRIPHIRLGSAIRFDVTELEKWIQQEKCVASIK